jgi:trans-aconitate methyltransferase
MVGQARQNFPHITFALQDVTKLPYEREFDAIFSNATLHWVPDAIGAARAMSRALKPGGRLAAELGGHGNTEMIKAAITAALAKHGANAKWGWYFPSIGEYAPVLEAAGFEVRTAHLFDRPTPLEGPKGLENWIRQFAWTCFDGLDGTAQREALAETIELARPTLLREGQWFADYRRLRIFAVKR